MDKHDSEKWRKKQRYYRLIYDSVQAILLAFVAAAGLFWGTKVALLVFIWPLWNLWFYHKGSDSKSGSLYQIECPSEGVKCMFNSWYYFIPIACIVIYWLMT